MEQWNDGGLGSTPLLPLLHHSNPLPMPAPYAQQTLGRRLLFSGADFLAADELLVTLRTRQRDVASVITPKGTAPDVTLILDQRDQGQVKNTPIRTVRLGITARANVRAVVGKPDAFEPIVAALELLFARRMNELANLKDALHSSSRGVAVMSATMRPPIGRRVTGDIREQRYELDCKCLLWEQTNLAVPDGAWVDGDGTQMVDGDGTSLIF